MKNKIRLWLSRNAFKYVTILIIIIIAYSAIKILNNTYKVQKENHVDITQFNDVTDWDIEVDEPELLEEEIEEYELINE